MESTTIDKSARPGRMDSFRITELSGVDVPACEGCTATIIKAADGLDPDRSSPDGMRSRGASLMASPDDEDDAPPELEPGESINWQKTAAAHEASMSAMAKARAQADGCTYEQAYAKLLHEHPKAGRRMVVG